MRSALDYSNALSERARMNDDNNAAFFVWSRKSHDEARIQWR